MKWIDWRLEKASFLSFAIWFAIWFAFNWWAFNMESPWTRALAAGGGTLPEAQFGFPANEPERSINLLGEATGDYVLWQAFDIPYALLNLMITSIAMALGLNALRLAASPLRFLLLLPPLYVLAECAENAFVAAFAAKALPLSDTLVLIQQAATSVKLASGYGSMWIGLLGLAIALLAIPVRLLRKKSA